MWGRREGELLQLLLLLILMRLWVGVEAEVTEGDGRTVAASVQWLMAATGAVIPRPCGSTDSVAGGCGSSPGITTNTITTSTTSSTAVHSASRLGLLRICH